MPVFLDSNVFLYAAGAEHPHKAACIEILRAVSEGRLKANTSVEVVQEILYVYLRRGLRQEAERLCGNVMKLFPALLPVTREDMLGAMSLVSRYEGLPARDLIHAACMIHNGMDTIVSVDRHFDQMAELIRLEPGDVSDS